MARFLRSAASEVISLFIPALLVFIALANRIISPSESLLFTALGLFSFLVYFSLMWKFLYKFNYHYYLLSTYRLVLRNILLSLVFSLAGTILIALFLFSDSQTRLLLFGFIFSLHLMYLITHIVKHTWIRYLSKLGYFHKQVLFIGEPDDRFPIEELFQDSGRTKSFSGILLPGKKGTWKLKKKAGEKESKEFMSLEEAVYNSFISEIIIFMKSELSSKRLEEVVTLCHENHIGYYLVPNVESLPRNRYWSYFRHIPIIEHYSYKRDSLSSMSFKRVFDIVFSFVTLAVFLPFGLIIAALIYLEDRGPIFYVSKRIGKNGRSFNFYKFRSMVRDAEKLKEKLKKFNERSDGPLFKMKNDPRITRVGRILRKTSLDEFPQFINVLLGHMSVVGPRPHLPEEVDAYSTLDYLRLECIPGITCYPQVIDRNNMGFREWVDWDLRYRRDWSTRLDFKIILKTVGIVLSSIFGKKSDLY